MNKISIALILSLCFLLSSCGILSLEYKVTEDTLSDISAHIPQTSYTEIQTRPSVVLPELNTGEQANDQLASLPSVDFREKYFGENENSSIAYFTIATIDYAPVFESADEISGSHVARVVNEVENKFNIDIINTPYSEEEFDAKIKESMLSGKYFADLLSLPGVHANTYATSEYCTELSKVPFINKDAKYFSSDVFEYGADFGKYAVMGDMSYLTCDLECLYFDITAIGDEIYTKAFDNTLDWEYLLSKMYETGRGIKSREDLAHIYRLSSGVRHTSEGSERDTELLEAKIERLLLYCDDEDPLFVIDTIKNFKNYAMSETKYGVLPLPTASDGERYGYLRADRVNYFLCPRYTTTTEGAGLVMSALCAASGMAEAEILITMIRDSARDNGTLFVSHLLFSRPAWDYEYFCVEKAPDPIPDQPPVQEQTPEKT